MDVANVVSGLTLEAIEQMALQNSPSIRQSSAAANKASGITTQVGLNPNPTVGYFGEEIGNEKAVAFREYLFRRHLFAETSSR